MKTATIALVDDHVLLRKCLANLLTELGYEVLLEAENGKDLIKKMELTSVPDLVLLDVDMPQMDGNETALWLKQNHLEVKILALFVFDDHRAIDRILQNGADGFIFKNCDPSEFKVAIRSLLTNGFYFP